MISKKIVVTGLLLLSVVGLFVGMTALTSVEAAGGMKGTAYISGHGGHLAIIDLATLKEPTDIEKDRIVISEAGSEMEGKIAGMDFEAMKKGGGSHGAALVNNNKTLVVGLLNGKVVQYDIATGKKTAPMDLGKKFCDAVVGPDGNIYFEDMADGNVYVWDYKTMKAVDKMPVGASMCGIAWTRDNKKAFISEMPTGVVYVYDWTTKKEIAKITDPEMTFLHQVALSPDGKSVWVTAPNEYDPGLKPGTHKPQIIVIDVATNKITEKIVLPDDVRLHDIEFTPDGKTALIAARTYKDDSLLVLMDVKTRKIEKRVSACLACHKKAGVEVTIDNKSPLLCGIVVDWKK